MSELIKLFIEIVAICLSDISVKKATTLLIVFGVLLVVSLVFFVKLYISHDKLVSNYIDLDFKGDFYLNDKKKFREKIVTVDLCNLICFYIGSIFSIIVFVSFISLIAAKML